MEFFPCFIDIDKHLSTVAFGYSNTEATKYDIEEYFKSSQLNTIFDKDTIFRLVDDYMNYYYFIRRLLRWSKWYIYDKNPVNKPEGKETDEDMIIKWNTTVKQLFEKLRMSNSFYEKVLYTQLLNDHLWNPKFDPMNPKIQEYNRDKLLRVSTKGSVITEASGKDVHFKLYHVSEENLNGKVLTPRIPDNFLTKHGYEENKTPRVSFSTSIDGCLVGLSQNIKDKEFFVFEPDDYSKIQVKGVNVALVPDAQLTHEKWVTTSVKLKLVGKIKVHDAKDPALTYTYGPDNTKAEMYAWNWEHVKEKIHEATLEYDRDSYKLMTMKLESNIIDIFNNSTVKLQALTEADDIGGIKLETAKLEFINTLIEANSTFSDTKPDSKLFSIRGTIRKELHKLINKSVGVVTLKESSFDLNSFYESTAFYTAAINEYRHLQNYKEFIKVSL